jgi:hypothetical protein
VDAFRATQLQALVAVLRPDYEYRLRQVHRWYSQTFYVPLPEVSDLPIDEVLQAYYETHYEQMSAEERAEERRQLLKTPEESFDELLREEAEEAEMYTLGQLMAAEELERRRKAQAEKQIAVIPRLNQGPLPEADLPAAPLVTDLPPDVSITFVDDAELEAEAEAANALSSLSPPKG